MLTVATVQSGTFTFPSLYSFPPFFTRQPNAKTWSHQLWSLTLSDSQCQHELFHNKQIDRRLPLAVLREVVDYMVQQGSAAYDPSSASSAKNATTGSAAKEGAIVWLYWKRPEEWATSIYDWVRDTGQTNSIMTFYELTESDESTEFYGLPDFILRKALEVLAKQGKAQVFQGIGEQGDGVKFV